MKRKITIMYEGKDAIMSGEEIMKHVLVLSKENFKPCVGRYTQSCMCIDEAFQIKQSCVGRAIKPGRIQGVERVTSHSLFGAKT